MAIPKQLLIAVIIGFLIGASVLYAFTQYSSTTKDNQIVALQNQVTALENYIFFNSQESAGMPRAGAEPSPEENQLAVIQAVSFNIEGDLEVLANATADKDVTIVYVWISDTDGNIVIMDKPSVVLPADGTPISIIVVLPSGVLNSGSEYTVTLVSVYGGSVVSEPFTVY